MKKFVPAFLTIALVAGAILNQGCEDSSKSNALNQKVDALSTKLDTVLQNQAEIQKFQNQAKAAAQFDATLQQDAIVSRVDKSDYYYATNILNSIDLSMNSQARQFANIMATQNDLKEQINGIQKQISGIEKQIKPRYGGDFETLGDKINAMKLSIDLIENDNQKIKSKLGILY
jgi:outer membrane murein-binding lipoprotein Lpp